MGSWRIRSVIRWCLTHCHWNHLHHLILDCPCRGRTHGYCTFRRRSSNRQRNNLHHLWNSLHGRSLHVRHVWNTLHWRSLHIRQLLHDLHGRIRNIRHNLVVEPSAGHILWNMRAWHVSHRVGNIFHVLHVLHILHILHILQILHIVHARLVIRFLNALHILHVLHAARSNF